MTVDMTSEPTPGSASSSGDRGRPVHADGAREVVPVARPRRGHLRRRLIGAILALGTIGLCLVVLHQPLLVGFAHLFRVDDPAPADALVLLHGGISHRPVKALELYKKGLAPVILMGETEPIPVLEADEDEQMRKYLTRNGVPEEAVRTLPGGEVTSTFDEAVRVRDYVRSHPVRRIVLVTTSCHTARACWIFRKSLRGEGVEVRAAAVRRPEYDESNWYRTEQGLLDYFEETIRTVRYRIMY